MFAGGIERDQLEEMGQNNIECIFQQSRHP